MSDIDMWNLVVGFLSATFVLPIIQRSAWDEWMRSAVTFGYCLVVGLGTTWLTGAADGRPIPDVRAAVTAVLLVFVSAITTYKGFAGPTGIARKLETATTPKGSRS
jgi:hypothetical protein